MLFYFKSKMQNSDEICNNLFVGNRQSLYTPYVYNMIVNCTPSLPFPEINAHFLRVPVKDHPNNSNTMVNILHNDGILDKINECIINGENVLINCNQGIQRSCAVCACYLVKYHGYTPLKAVKYIKLKRPQAFDGQVNFIDAIRTFNSRKYKK